MQTFLTVLEEQLKGYEELLQLAKEKQQLLINNDINQLDILNKNEQKLLLELTKLENQRLEIIQGLQEMLGANVPTMTLKEIAQSVPEPHQSKLSDIYKKFDAIVAQLDEVNQENANLIKQALKYVNFTMDMLAKEEREVTYSQKETGVKKTSRIFDHKV